LWVLNDLLDERADADGGATWRVASADLRGRFAGRLHDVPETPEHFVRDLREMAERAGGGRIAVLTGKRVEHTRRGVEIRRAPHAPPRARRHGSGSGGSTEEGALSGAAHDLILLALEDLGAAYPGELAEATGLSPKTVTNNLPALAEAGRVRYTGERGPGGSKRVEFVPQRPAVEDLDPFGVSTSSAGWSPAADDPLGVLGGSGTPAKKQGRTWHD